MCTPGHCHENKEWSKSWSFLVRIKLSKHCRSTSGINLKSEINCGFQNLCIHTPVCVLGHIRAPPVIRGPMSIHPHQVKDNSIYRWEKRSSLFIKQDKKQFIKNQITKCTFYCKKCKGINAENQVKNIKNNQIFWEDGPQSMAFKFGSNFPDWQSCTDLHLFDQFFALIKTH